mgnify:CR=1 FL=1
MKGKIWYESWTIWANIVGILVIGLQMVLSMNLVIDPEWQALILAVLNLLLRFKTTNGVKLVK